MGINDKLHTAHKHPSITKKRENNINSLAFNFALTTPQIINKHLKKINPKKGNWFYKC